MLTACASHSPAPQTDSLLLNGQLVYRDRMAMPPQAVAAIELRYYNLDGEAVLTSTRQPLEGRQVPLPFHIKADIPASDAQGLLELRAAIELDGRL
ncbi:YbaY family lipoprotein, partial [Arthrospira platensis SPKY1]|nr:YbaY family lipoprotein [Arthrospira platensis SPKY1]